MSATVRGRPITVLVLIFLLVFLGLGGVLGGVGMLLDTSHHAPAGRVWLQIYG